MIKFSQLNKDEQSKILSDGMKYFVKNKSTVRKSVDKNTEKSAPTGSDLYHPELWKPSHWKWFLDNNFLL